jgi:HNH endonuclease/Protein of unknown function (DUF2934)
MSETRKCVYCGCDKPTNQFSLEHIWPDALGGAACGGLFKTRHVCRHCNSKSGLWVDGEFLKSWFVRNESALSEEQYLDPVHPTTVSLTYLGVQSDLALDEGLVCERWAGPCGEHIYHFHAEDDGKWFGYAGGDIIRRKRADPGRAYIVLTSQSAYWTVIALRSFALHFNKAKRRCLTAVAGMPDAWSNLAPPPDVNDRDEAKEVALIGAKGSSGFHVRVPVRLDMSGRFLAKVALGLGFNLLGEAFVATAYAQELRSAVHESDQRKRSALRVRGSGFLLGPHDNAGARILSWSGAWTILIKVIANELCLTICSPSGHMMAVVVSDDPALWADGKLQNYQDGQVFLLLPQRSECSAPVVLPDFLAHRSGVIRQPELGRLERLRIDPRSLPDKALSRAEGAAREQMTQERAYFTWMCEGCPQGKHVEHWLRAERDLGFID